MALPGGHTTAQLSAADRIALTAAYDQLFGIASGLPDREAPLRDQLLALTPGRAAVGGLVTFGGIVSYLYGDVPHTDLAREILLSSLGATHYPELNL